MAVGATSARLTEAHRLAQLALGATVARQVVASWRMLDVADVDAGTDQWLTVVRPVVQRHRTMSIRISAAYLRAFRAAEGVDTPFTPSLADLAPAGQVETSMLVTGPVALKTAIRNGAPLVRALDIAKSRSGSAAMRLALDGGRDTVMRTVADDRHALGWARATSGRACAFCAMLASRGPVYSQGSVDFHTHDGCSCTPEPVYRNDAAWPAGAQQYRDLWDSSTAGLGGDEARNAFRAALTGSAA